MGETPPRRGRPATLSVEAVCLAAVRVIERSGLDACTMRSVAAELGSSPMSVYRHVADKDTLLGLIPDIVLEDVSADVLRRRTAMTALAAVAEGVSDVLQAHPSLAPLFAQPTVGPRMLAAGEHCVALLVESGWSPDDAVEVLQAVVAQVIGEFVTRTADDADHALGGAAAGRVAGLSWGVRLLLAGAAQGPPPA